MTVLLMIVLVGQPELADRITRFPSLKSRMISSSVTEMTRDDMERMIAFRWGVAAGNNKANPPFTPKSYQLIYQITKGNPRDTVKICEQAVLQALIKKTKTVTPQLIKKASEEL